MMTHVKSDFKSQRKHQQGAVLFVGLMLLLIMTIVAVTAMRSTNLEVRMAHNDNQKMKAFASSDGPRPLSGDVLDDHIFDRGWNEVASPGGLKVISDGSVFVDMDDPDGTGTYCSYASSTWSCEPDNLYDTPPAVLTYTALLKKHMVYSFVSGEGGTKLTLNKVAVKLAAGTSAAMVSGYEGTGKAAAASGAHMFYDIRSAGLLTEAKTTTGTDYRIVIRN